MQCFLYERDVFYKVLGWIMMESICKKHRVRIHRIRFKTERRRVLEALTILRVV
jgi:hypothetical protein